MEVHLLIVLWLNTLLLGVNITVYKYLVYCNLGYTLKNVKLEILCTCGDLALGFVVMFCKILRVICTFDVMNDWINRSIDWLIKGRFSSRRPANAAITSLVRHQRSPLAGSLVELCCPGCIHYDVWCVLTAFNWTSPCRLPVAPHRIPRNHVTRKRRPPAKRFNGDWLLSRVSLPARCMK